MRANTYPLTTPALLLALVLAAAPAVAQQAAPPPAPAPDQAAPAAPAARPAPTPPRPMMRPPHPAETMQGMVERRITELHQRLHITSEQSDAWGQFAQVMRDNAREAEQAFHDRATRLAAMSAVENLQSYAEIERSRAADVQKLATAFQQLYGTLSDPQKKTADQVFRTYGERAAERRAEKVKK